jgi:broad specificity phosphatase PhoE
MKLYIIRHADPDYPNGTITAKGHKEAQALAGIMDRLEPTHLYSSPLGRARHTADYTVKATGLPLGIEDWTREIEGYTVAQEEPYGLHMVWDYHPQHIKALQQDKAANGRALTQEDWLTTYPYQPIGYDQVINAVAENSDKFLARHGMVREGHVYRIVESGFGGSGTLSVRSQKIAVFCHGGFGLTWLAHLLQIPFPLVYSNFYLWPSSVTTLLFDERVPGIATPRCIGLGDISHLAVAGLPPQPRGLVANSE